MLEIVSKNNNLYNVLDTEDGVVESCSFLDIISAIQSGVAVKASGEVVKDYEMDSECLRNGVNTFEEYVAYKKQKLKEFFGHDVNCEIKSEDYTFRISFDFAKHYIDKLLYKE